MTVLQLPAIKKREITSGTKEWADYNVNCAKGCFNNCRYCYAKMIAKRFKRCTEETWKEMEIRNNTVGKTLKKYNGRVMFPSTHDIFDEPQIKNACFIVIQNLLKSGNELLITTKPRLSITKDIVGQFYSFIDTLQFRFSITSLNNDLLSFWEPNAPPYEERLEALKYAFYKGFKTSVSIEPFLDYNPQELIKIVSLYVTESIWIGPMNYIPVHGINDNDKQQYTDIRRKYEINHLWEIYEDLRDFPKIRFKDSMTNRLGLPKQIELINNTLT